MHNDKYNNVPVRSLKFYSYSKSAIVSAGVLDISVPCYITVRAESKQLCFQPIN